MNSTVKQLSPVMTELTVEVSKEDIAAALDKAYSHLGRTAKLRGFRKGKVPRAVLKRMFGDAVRNDVRGDVVSTHLQVALKENDVIPLSEPDFEAGELNDNEAYSFKVKFETRQKLEKLDWDGIELERYKIVLDPEQVDKQIETMRSSMAEVVDLEEPRPAAMGDLAKIKLKSWADGEWKDSPYPEQELVVGEEKLEKKIDAAIIGMNVDDEKVVDLGSEKEMEEERTRYMVCLLSIQGRKLPELDDEFAKDVGDYETLDELKKSVEERLNKDAVLAEDRRVQNLFFDALREKNPVEFPPTLLENQKGAFAMRVQSSLAMLGDNSPSEEEQKDMLERAEKAAMEMVHQHLLVLECSRHENLEMTEEEVDKSIEEFADERGLPLPMVRAEYGKEGRREELSHNLLEKKIFDFALPKVKITEVEPPAESTDGKGK
ncbi:MAG: trigger factor [Deltaproteobacteria bacterium]|nr:trigger factor [Deltaproteobacteria bacterium]